jgi:hypothetical protein
MANCKLLLNNDGVFDGGVFDAAVFDVDPNQSFLRLNDGTSILLLNDNSCGEVQQQHDVFAEESRHRQFGKYHIHEVRVLSERGVEPGRISL